MEEGAGGEVNVGGQANLYNKHHSSFYLFDGSKWSSPKTPVSISDFQLYNKGE